MVKVSMEKGAHFVTFVIGLIVSFMLWQFQNLVAQSNEMNGLLKAQQVQIIQLQRNNDSVSSKVDQYLLDDRKDIETRLQGIEMKLEVMSATSAREKKEN